jgi:hypothetical protein
MITTPRIVAVFSISLIAMPSNAYWVPGFSGPLRSTAANFQTIASPDYSEFFGRSLPGKRNRQVHGGGRDDTDLARQGCYCRLRRHHVCHPHTHHL